MSATPPNAARARRAPSRVAVIGTGLIGASLGLALRRLDDVEEVVGYDADPAELEIAVKRGAVSRAASSAREAAEGVGLAVLAVPLSAIGSVAAEVAPVLPKGSLLTDVASVKGRAVEALQAAAPAGVHVIGGHPMAGSHETGASHASADLFVGATYLLTPTTHTDAGAFEQLHALISRIGARPLAVEPERHDLLVAVVSHLPQLAATTLMNLASERARSEHAGLLLLAAGGFRDATRVAASNPDLWLEICGENRDAIISVLDDYVDRVERLRAVLAGSDDAGLRRVLDDAREARRTLPGKEVPAGTFVELLIAIPDRPGLLAEVTTTVGGVGVNIEDLSIEHAAEGGRGVLRLQIAGEHAAAVARGALEQRGHEVVERIR